MNAQIVSLKLCINFFNDSFHINAYIIKIRCYIYISLAMQLRKKNRVARIYSQKCVCLFTSAVSITAILSRSVSWQVNKVFQTSFTLELDHTSCRSSLKSTIERTLFSISASQCVPLTCFRKSYILSL